MTEQPPYPVHPDPFYKFKPNNHKCGPGEPVMNTAQRTIDDKMCCSSCRGLMHVEEGIWVHD